MSDLQPDQSKSRPHWLTNFLIRWNAWIILILGISVVAIQIIENPGRFIFMSPLHYLELFIFFSLMFGLTITNNILKRTITEKSNTAHLLHLKHNHSLKFASARNLEELAGYVLRLPVTIVPATKYSSLLIYYSDLGRFEWAGEWKSEDNDEFTPIIGENVDECHDCILNRPNQIQPLEFCDLYAKSLADVHLNGYCLPLKIGTELVASLHFILSPNSAITEQQNEILNNIGTEIAIAIKSALHQQHLAEIKATQAAISERHQIFQDLHDVLSQNLGFLRMKLDQYTIVSSGQYGRLPEMELEQMRDVAMVSYEIVRGSLKDLRTSSTPYLSSLLNHQSKLIGSNYKFEYKFSETGQPRPLPPQILQNTYFICKEAINNIAKHSGASQVEGKLIWESQNLTIEITDNGKGFDPKSINPQGHYGLSIMLERVQRINGSFDIQSAIGAGTKVTICIPIAIEKGYTRENLN